MRPIQAILLASISSMIYHPLSHAAPSDDIFTRERQIELCRDVNGEQIVDRESLALAMFNNANLPGTLLHIDRRLGEEENATNVMSRQSLPDDHPSVSPEDKINFERQKDSFGNFITFQGLGNKFYSVRSAKTGTLLPRDFFGFDDEGKRIPRVVTIVCLDVPQNDARSISETLDEFGKHIRVRGTHQDLARTGTSARTADPAELAFTNNISANTRTIQVDGAVGIAKNFDVGDSRFSLIPFAEYHNRTTTRAGSVSSKVETLGFGTMVNVLSEFGPVAWELGMTPQYIIDEAQNGGFFRGDAYLSPSFTIVPAPRSAGTISI